MSELLDVDTCDEVRSAWSMRAGHAERRAAQRLTRPEMRVDARDVRALLATLDAAVAEVVRLREQLADVKALHYRSVDALGTVYCEWCDGSGQLWPCETVAALSEKETQ